MNIKIRICVQKWQREHPNYYFYYQKVVPFVTKIAFFCFLWTSSGQNGTLNFVDAACKCENRPTSENTLLCHIYLPDSPVESTPVIRSEARIPSVEIVTAVVSDPGVSNIAVAAEVAARRIGVGRGISHGKGRKAENTKNLGKKEFL